MGLPTEWPLKRTFSDAGNNIPITKKAPKLGAFFVMVGKYYLLMVILRTAVFSPELTRTM
jgi:hypothetical protein